MIPLNLPPPSTILKAYYINANHQTVYFSTTQPSNIEQLMNWATDSQPYRAVDTEIFGATGMRTVAPQAATIGVITQTQGTPDRSLEVRGIDQALIGVKAIGLEVDGIKIFEREVLAYQGIVQQSPVGQHSARLSLEFTLGKINLPI